MGPDGQVCRWVETEVRQKWRAKVGRRSNRGKVCGADPDAVDIALPLDGDRALRQSLASCGRTAARSADATEDFSVCYCRSLGVQPSVPAAGRNLGLATGPWCGGCAEFVAPVWLNILS